jgi:hypothetical protein
MDRVTGVSANIMTGQPIRGGTAFVDILLDEIALMRLQQGLPPAEPLDGDAPPPTDEEIDASLIERPDDMCAPSNLEMNLTLPQARTLVDEDDIELVEV